MINYPTYHSEKFQQKRDHTCSVMMNNWYHKDIRHLAKDEWVLDINSIFYRSLPTGKRIDKICWFNRMYFGTDDNIIIIA